MATWQVQSAKQRFSEVVRAAQGGEAQFITKHGRPVAVLLDIEEYTRNHAARPSVVEFILSGPDLSALQLPERNADGDRPPAILS